MHHLGSFDQVGAALMKSAMSRVELNQGFFMCWDSL